MEDSKDVFAILVPLACALRHVQLSMPKQSVVCWVHVASCYRVSLLLAVSGAQNSMLMSLQVQGQT